MSFAFPATIPVRLTPSGLIDADLSCPSCGYNLRMQPITGDCPECGLAIDGVACDDKDQLFRADSRWRSRVGRGATWLHRGVLIAPAGVLPGLIAAAAALWLLTTPEPGRPETRRARGSRRSARWAAVAAATAGVAAGLVGLLKHGPALKSALRQPDGGPPGISSVLKLQREVAGLSRGWDTLDLLLCLAAAAMTVALLEAWRHLFGLAARADGPAVAQRCRKTWRGYLIAGALLVALALSTTLGHALGLGLPDRWYEWTVVLLIGVVGLVLLWIWWVTLRLTGELVRVLDTRASDRPAPPLNVG